MKLIFIIIDPGAYYRDATVDYEALSLARNTRRLIKMLKQHGYLAA